jgi:iron complex transport system substrate-binding protein
MMFRKLTFALLALIFVVSACGPMTPVPTAIPTEAATLVPTEIPTLVDTSRSLTDGLGRAVTLSAPAQKVVSLAPSNTEILFAIGAGAQTIGRDEFSDYPAEAKSLPSVGGSMGNYSTEQIAALKPDLVLAAEINTPEQVKAISDLGLTVYYLSNPKTLEDLYVNLETVAKLTGHESDAATLVASLKARVTAVDEKIMPLSAQPTVFYEVDASDPAKPYSVGPGTFVDLLIKRAGGANLVDLAGIKDAYPQVSLEQVVSANPGIILLGDAAYGATPESVVQRPGWDKIAAVQNKQVFAFDDNLVSRPGPRMVDGLETLAKLLHPGVFK